MKQKIFRGLLIISFLPYVLLIITALYSAFAGYDVYTMILPTYVKTIYGVEALKEVLFWNLITFTIIPVLPICLIYQLVYLILCRSRKMKLKKKDHSSMAAAKQKTDLDL